jgi:hypothetical protein
MTEIERLQAAYVSFDAALDARDAAFAALDAANAAYDAAYYALVDARAAYLRRPRSAREGADR